MKIDQYSVRDIIPYARNPRNNDDAIDKVAASIKEFGFRQPIVVDTGNVIIVGHTRFEAAKRLSLAQVPVHVADNLSDAQIKAYRLADNRTAQYSEWDDELLAIELGDLQEMDFDLDLTGFAEDELAGLLAKNDDPLQGLVDEDSTPDAPDIPTTRPGDIWIMGEHRLMCGDATSIDAMDKLMGDDKADLVFTDPPYGMSYGGGRAEGDHVLDKKGAIKIKAHGEIINDNLRGTDLVTLVRDALTTATTAKTPDAAVYVCFTWRTYTEFFDAINNTGLKMKACIVWDKRSIGLGYANYRPQHEFMFYCEGKWFGPNNESDVWICNRDNRTEYVHPTQKPVELIERAINNSCKHKGIVLDCFGGSGSTLIACTKNNRKARLMELDPKYCDVVVRRWQDYTGKPASLETTGKSFSEIETQTQQNEV